jgi:trimeric autotransporter adhesin
MASKSYRKFMATGLSAAVVASVVAPVAGAASFDDVKPGSWYEGAVNYVSEKGYMNGTDKGFEPGKEMTRAQAAALFANILGIYDESLEADFSDVKEGAWYYGAVAAVQEHGIMAGTGSAFNPEGKLTRGQVAALVVRAYDLQAEGAEHAFTDVEGNMFENEIAILAELGIASGTNGGETFEPGKVITRAEMAAFIQKTEEMLETPVFPEVTSVEVVDTTSLEVTVDGAWTQEDVDALIAAGEYELTVVGEDVHTVGKVTVKAAEASASADTTTLVLSEISPELPEGDFHLEVNGYEIGGSDFTYEAPATPEVTSVSAITKTNVKVTFKALEEADSAFTVEVLDNNGKVVEVTPVSLEKGETEATLTFKTPLGVDPVGVWTVGGVEFDLDAIKNYNDIVAASLSLNEVTTLAALKKAGLSDVKDDNITAYVTAINASTTKEKLADIQVIVTKTNETAVTGAEAAAAVKAVNDATNQVQLLAALQHKAFTRVNADWIVAYDVAIGTGNTTVVGIQGLIDGENNTKIGAANTAATTVAEQNAVTNLIKLYTADDVAPATTKAAAIKASEVKAGVFGVKEATTAASLYNALVKLSTLDSTGLPAASLNANLKSAYLVQKNTGTPVYTNAGTIATSIVGAADTVELNAALLTIDGLSNTSTTTQIKSALQKLADVTAHKTGVNKFDMSTVKDANLTKYVTLATDGFAAQAIDTIAEVNTAIATVELNTALDTVNSATVTASEASAALLNLAVVRTGTPTAKADSDAFISLSAQGRLEVAQLVIDNRPALGYADLNALISATGTGAVKTQQAAHVAQVAKFNAIGDLSAATTAGTKDNLDLYAYAPYVALSASQKVAVAEEINKLTKTTTAGGVTTTTSLNFGTADAVTTLKQANDYIDAAITKVK